MKSNNQNFKLFYVMRPRGKQNFLEGVFDFFLEKARKSNLEVCDHIELDGYGCIQIKDVEITDDHVSFKYKCTSPEHVLKLYLYCGPKYDDLCFLLIKAKSRVDSATLDLVPDMISGYDPNIVENVYVHDIGTYRNKNVSHDVHNTHNSLKKQIYDECQKLVNEEWRKRLIDISYL